MRRGRSSSSSKASSRNTTTATAGAASTGRREPAPDFEERQRQLAALRPTLDRYALRDQAEWAGKELEARTLALFFAVLRDPTRADPRLRQQFRGPSGSYRVPWSASERSDPATSFTTRDAYEATTAEQVPSPVRDERPVVYARLGIRSLRRN